jgi:hypothetical protein
MPTETIRAAKDECVFRTVVEADRIVVCSLGRHDLALPHRSDCGVQWFDPIPGQQTSTRAR